MGMEEACLKIGKFAEACGVKKATLIHYADIGLLKPAYIGENGYSYYTAEQIYDFELIHVLKSMDIPLSEIKNYIENTKGDIPACTEILEKSVAALRERQKQLHSMERLIQNTLRDMRELKDLKLGVIEEVTFDEPEYYYVYKMPYRTADSTYLLNETRNIIKHIQDSFLNESINVVEVVMQKDLLNGSFRKRYGGFRAKKEILEQGENVIARPPGTYLTVCDKKGGDSIAELYQTLKDHADANGYEICGNGYGRDLLSHIVERDREHYFVRCYIQVKRAVL